MINIQIPRRLAFINFAEQLVKRAVDHGRTSNSDISFVPNFPRRSEPFSPELEVESKTEVQPIVFLPSVIEEKRRMAQQTKWSQAKTKLEPNKKGITKRLSSLIPERVAGLHGVIHFETGDVELKWHPQEEALYYTVQFNETSYDELQWKTLSTSISARVNINSLEKGKEYHFRVKAHTENHAGEWSGLCCLKLN